MAEIGPRVEDCDSDRHDVVGRSHPPDETSNSIGIEGDAKDGLAVANESIKVERQATDAAGIGSETGEVAIVGQRESLQVSRCHRASVKFSHSYQHGSRV
jgi:hypothetical protein